MSLQTTNHHCTCIKFADTGLMIEGQSGSGKTSLALGLYETAKLRGVHCEFVCDDQAFMSVFNDNLWVKAPEPVAGKVEVHGYGITQIPHINSCRIDLICDLVDQKLIERLPEPQSTNRMGLLISTIRLPMQHETQSIRIILQKLGFSL